MERIKTVRADDLVSFPVSALVHSSYENCIDGSSQARDCARVLILPSNVFLFRRNERIVETKVERCKRIPLND